MAWEWNFDEGNLGDFGGADYYKALLQGGTQKSELQATRDALAGWARTNPKGKAGQTLKRGGHEDVDWGTRSAFWGQESGDSGSSNMYDIIMGKNKGVGWTGYGDFKKQKDENWGESTHESKGWYTEADLLGGLAEGQSYGDIEQHFQDTSNISKLRPGSDLLKRISEGAADERAEGYKKKISGLDANISKLESSYKDKEASLQTLQSKYDNELQQLKKAQLAVKHSSPTAVAGPTSATGIRFAKSPTLKGKGGFRGTLAGLTSSHGPAQKLKSTQVTV